MQRTLIFDTETTGLVGNSQLRLVNQPHVTEFYGHVVTFDGEAWSTIAELEFLCDPGIAITPEIVGITGITNEMVRGQPRFSKHARAIQELLSQADIVVAHNLAFDMAMLDIEARRLDIKWEWPAVRMCTVEATEHIKGHRLDLGSLYLHLYGEGFTGAHRARQDVHALTKCWARMRQMEMV